LALKWYEVTECLLWTVFTVHDVNLKVCYRFD